MGKAKQPMGEDVFHPFGARDMADEERFGVLDVALKAVNLLKEK